MSAWKVGGSKVFKPVVKDTMGMPKYMKDQGLNAYQITIPFNMNLLPENMNKILADPEIKIGFHAVNYTAHISSNKYYAAENYKHWENTRKYSVEYNIPAVIHVESKYWKDKGKQLESVLERLIRIIEDTDADPTLFYFENSGDKGQFGANFMDLYNLGAVLNTRICVDWAHLYAIHQENFSEELVKRVCELLERTTWKNEQWMHISGIEVNSGGEVKHVNLENSDFPYEMVLRILKESDLAGVIITESGYKDAHDSKLVQRLVN